MAIKPLPLLLLCLGLFSQPTHADTAFHLDIPKASQNKAMEFYGQFSERTVLSPTIPGFTIAINFTATTRTEAAKELEKAFKKKGLLVIPDGDKFVLIVPKSLVSNAVPGSLKIKTQELLLPSQSKQTPLRGDIDFPSISLPKAVDFYSKLLDCRLDPASVFPSGTPVISLHSQTSLSKEEVKYAFDTLFAWENIRIVRVAGDLIKTELILPK